ncbi:hypothetical protein BDV12DRAFT_197332 [Aspergillus spectabilis]
MPSPKGKEPIRGTGSPRKSPVRKSGISIAGGAQAGSNHSTPPNNPPAKMGFIMLSGAHRPPAPRPQPTLREPRPRPTGATVYQIYIGTTTPDYEKNKDPHWLVILRAPYADKDGLDCRWYHSLGTQWDETDRYRRAINERNFNNPFVTRKIPVGTMRETDMLTWNKCFKQTPPQESVFFCAKFLTKLVQRGVLREYEIAQVLNEIGPLPMGAEDDPDYRSGDEAHMQTTPDGTPLIFPIDL